MLKIYQDQDADLNYLKGRRIAVIGYGSQGCAQALMMLDSGLDVIVGVRKNGKSWKKALKDAQRVFTIAEAAKQADIIHILLPDELQADIYSSEILPYLKKEKTLSFSHGFNITYGWIKPPKTVDVIMVAPVAPGSEERSAYLAGTGVPAYVAVHQNPSGKALKTALALAKSMHFTKIGVMKISFEQETYTDLFGEQVVVCGGLSELVLKGFGILVKAGYPEEIAYFECLHQIALLSRLIKDKGIAGMWNEISNTAEFGARLAGPKIVNKESDKAMKEILRNVENGRFAKLFIDEYKMGMPFLKKMRQKDLQHPIEKVGQRLRKLVKKSPTA